MDVPFPEESENMHTKGGKISLSLYILGSLKDNLFSPDPNRHVELFQSLQHLSVQMSRRSHLLTSLDLISFYFPGNGRQVLFVLLSPWQVWPLALS